MKEEISDLQEHLGYWHNRFGQQVHTAFERRLAGHNVTVSQWCLMVVLYHKQADTVRGVAKVINLDAGAVTRLTDRLEEKQLVRRLPDKDDGRSIKLELTVAGTTLVPHLAKEADKNDEKFYGILSTREIIQYKKILSKLLQGMGTEVPKNWVEKSLKRELIE